MAEIFSPLQCLSPPRLIAAWTRQNHPDLKNARLQKLLADSRLLALDMLQEPDEKIAASQGLGLIELFTDLRIMCEEREVNVSDLSAVTQTAVLITCSVALFQTPEEKWDLYNSYHKDPVFNDLLVNG
ncbi:MAG TPA: hypothetical protein VHP58_05790 [Alphaproteobacteria bacterium]|nr:hypothetical protein [Alphaproteobacteria bacterium]